MLSLLLALTLPASGFGPTRRAVVAAAVLTVSLYFTGDLFVLPNLGNLVAAIGDGAVAGLMLYAMQFAIPGARLSPGWALVIGAGVGVAEYFYHRLLKRFDVVGNEVPQVMPKAWERALGRWLTDDEHWIEENQEPTPHPEYMGTGRP